MSEYKVIDNCLYFEELFSDVVGVNHRAAEVENRKPKSHITITAVHPHLSSNPDVWKRVRILLEGIRKSNISYLYSPDKIVTNGAQVTLHFPYIKGRSFEQILEDSEKRDMPINFDLAFSMAMAIADIIEVGSSIVVSGEKSFHGMLTPDNILVHFDGKIYLKNYGIVPYLERSDAVYSEFEKRYGAWLAPELVRREKLQAQSDIYHLGYLIYKMLTGKYFSCSPSEDFNQKFANITFKQHIPSTDKDFITNVITFFKKTLNPDVSKRFRTIKEFKEFISNFFHIEELSSITFNMAYFLNSLYSEDIEALDKKLEEEMKYVVPEPKKAESPEVRAEKDQKLVESLLEGLDERKGMPKWIWGLVAVLVVGVIIGFFLYRNAQNVAKQQEIALKEQEKKAAELSAQQQKQSEEKTKLLMEELQRLQKEKASTVEERKALEEKQKKIIEELDKKKKEDEDRLKSMQQAAREEEEKKRKEEETRKAQQQEEERKRQEEEARKAAELEKRRQEMTKLKEGSEVSSMDLPSKPEKIRGEQPTVTSSTMKKKYEGKVFTVNAMILIDIDGNVEKVKVIGTPVGDDIKDLLTRSLKEWKYKPMTKDNVRVKVWYTVPLKFKF